LFLDCFGSGWFVCVGWFGCVKVYEFLCLRVVWFGFDCLWFVFVEIFCCMGLMVVMWLQWYCFAMDLWFWDWFLFGFCVDKEFLLVLWCCSWLFGDGFCYDIVECFWDVEKTS
jgi:hypothetical protein